MNISRAALRECLISIFLILFDKNKTIVNYTLKHFFTFLVFTKTRQNKSLVLLGEIRTEIYYYCNSIL